MVKLSRGGKNNGPMIGRQKPRPLFPPGELPLFGPPPAYMRRPPGPPRPPPSMGPMGYGPPPPPLPPPPPPPMRPPPHHMGPPMPPPPGPMRHRARPVLPPPPPGPPLPLLQAPVMPPRPPPFMRGGRIKPHMGRMGMGMGMGKRLGKPMKKTKNKKNKPKPTSKNDGEHYCESCDRSWQTLEELEDHLQTHVICEYENCKFSAHPKIIAVHVKLQHLTGLFDRIKFSYSKEEVEKWRDERKRHYPTQKHIEEKNAAAKEKSERGERMDGNTMKFNRKFKQNGKRKLILKGHKVLVEEEEEEEDRAESDERSKINGRRRKRFRRTIYTPTGKKSFQRDLIMEEAKQVIKKLIFEDEKLDTEEKQQFSDEEWNNEVVKDKIEEEDKPKVCNVLAALSAAYDSDVEEEEQDQENNKKLENIEENYGNVRDNSVVSDNEAPEEVSCKNIVDGPNVYVKDENSSDINQKKEKLKEIKGTMENFNDDKRKVQNCTSVVRPKKFRKPTLLEKLLANEIRQERNHILQCIRYIINNNYFEDKPNKNITIDPKKKIISCSQ